MGLDWNPIGKPKPEHEEEFEQLFKLLGDSTASMTWRERIKRLLRGVDREAAKQRWFEIQISPFETLNAPRVGMDPKADEWARRQFRENAKAGETEEKFLEELRGHYVLALAPPCDGLPLYSNGSAGYVELFSFRAQFIANDCKEIVGDALLEKCYRSSLAPGLASLGGELKACAGNYALAHGVSHVADKRDIEAGEDSPDRKAHILFSAARWCEYWSSRGHGLEAYF